MDLARAIEEFRAAGPRSVHACATKLAALLRAHPDQIEGLPQLHELDDLVKRRYVARWCGAAFAEAADLERLSALLAACEPALRANVVHDLGNRKRTSESPWMEVVPVQLGDAAPEVVAAALYVFSQHAIPERRLVEVLDAIVGLLVDTRKSGTQKLASEARAVLDLRFAGATDVAPYFAALDRAKDPAIAKHKKAVATAWKAREADPVVRESRRLRDGRPDERIAAAKALAGMLAVDVVDIRGSFAAIADALGHADVAVREAAVELAAIACEEQGMIDEIIVLGRPLLQAREDTAPTVRDSATRAVMFLDRHRKQRGVGPLG